LPAFYTPEAARAVWGESIDKGNAKRDNDRAPLDIFAGGSVAIGDGTEELRERARPGAALYIGGMGARSKNFYNDIFAKSGYVDEAKIIQDLYLAGDKKAAEEAIPADYLAKSSLIGPEGFVKERLYALRESGVTSLNVSFAGQNAEERVAQCEKLRNLVDSM
jgi:alkanesulfonate monooxygenase SsuD/methylene tetrahydromethanopterin reductase-like flavin-dependent oxidoreductase (luciferase family)